MASHSSNPHAHCYYADCYYCDYARVNLLTARRPRVDDGAAAPGPINRYLFLIRSASTIRLDFFDHERKQSTIIDIFADLSNVNRCMPFPRCITPFYPTCLSIELHRYMSVGFVITIVRMSRMSNLSWTSGLRKRGTIPGVLIRLSK